MTPTEIRKLLGLAEQGKTRELAVYARYVQDLEQLTAQKAALLTDARNAPIGGQDFGATARWQTWTQQELHRLKGEAARLEAEKERSRQAAANAVSRVLALEVLLKKALHAELLQNRRRAEQNGAPPDA